MADYLVIVGCGALAREAFAEFDDLLRDQEELKLFPRLVGMDFMADLHWSKFFDVVTNQTDLEDFAAVKQEWSLDANNRYHLLVAVGSPNTRKRIVVGMQEALNDKTQELVNEQRSSGFSLTRENQTLALSRVGFANTLDWLWPLVPRLGNNTSSTFGLGTWGQESALVSVDCSFGEHCFVGYSATVGHDCQIGNYVSIYAGARVSGSVQIGSNTEIGAGAVILPGIKVGSGVTIGAGAVVTKHVPDGEVWVGNPARPIERN